MKQEYIGITRDVWQKEWTSRSDCRQSKLWLPTISAPTKALHRLSRPALSACIQWITGFCNLRRHRHLKNSRKFPDPTCRLCGEEEETPAHLTCTCPRLIQARQNYFYSWNPLESWKPDQVCQFIEKTSCSDLMVDHTDYAS